ncbi:wd-40 repeat protein : WD repeat-containing protein, putative OS=Talaromyces stipitatus (strain ATCC 10500 / CBS 375.48 / QM 6759 / NRRL 1006) GN=TSTA_110140 PE=4 SV=1 [Gemmataceae bacterium]|nr:wd-40 repeat protein : WD repeat-containing protein, putative OS=Talaromyces stipitatus (strain ATCC 10500 / CBS 375.48 / QM 6759 / NRRL 1006) GN=TSTA_110140 PE=4 SV=1 [Gemmataceae bacterium]VTT99127.1 wd-40 repeat protein : WD repeat-containing protein, putative OS=Talaromyces stipitatus (strain ATCC 10500 / CBS 375.48 / QM 6759 / NRRL 1006) GN=TSTA_110140 PE=4 SV=1 [Gemmataceae bacterium]
MRILVAACAAGFVGLPALGLLAGADEPSTGADRPPEMDKFKVVRTLEIGDRPTSPHAFSPDSQVLAVAAGKRVLFRSTVTGKEARPAWDAEEFLDGSEKNITYLAFVDARTVAVSAEPNHVVHLRSYPTGERIAQIDLGTDSVSYLATAPGLVAVASEGKIIRVWSAPQWKKPLEIVPVKGYASGLAFSPDRSEVAVGQGAKICVYGVRDGKLIRQTVPESPWPYSVKLAYAPDGRSIALTTEGGWGPLAGRQQPQHVIELRDVGLKTVRTSVKWDVVASGLQAQAYHLQYTADGKTLLALCNDQKVRMFETATGGLRTTAHLPGVLNRVSLSPDGRLIGIRTNNWSEWQIELLDWRAAAEQGEPLEAAGLDAAWNDLASPDSGAGHKTVVRLCANPGLAINLIAERLRPVPVVNDDLVAAWVADLGSESFARREAAEKRLTEAGDLAEASLRAAAQSDSVERQIRAARVLKSIESGTRDRVRALRVVEVLEYLNTPMCRDVLKGLAAGAPGARQTLDARSALARLESSDPKP